MIESVRTSDQDNNIVVIKDTQGIEFQYLSVKGNLVLGSAWTGKTPEGDTVRFFLPALPGSVPIVLGVEIPDTRIIPSAEVKGIVDTIENMGSDAPAPLKRLWGHLIGH